MNINKKYLNGLAIVVVEGKIYNNTITEQQWEIVDECCNKLKEEMDEVYMDSLLDIMVPGRVEERIKNLQSLELDTMEKSHRLRKAKRIVDISDIFEYDEDGLCYLKGYGNPMPKIMIESLLDAKYNPASSFTVDSLVNLWKWLALNPDKHIRTQLWDWLKTSKFSITEDGMIIGYRNVDVKKKSSSKGLQEFVSEQYAKIKKWKKSPKNYYVGYNIDNMLMCTQYRFLLIKEKGNLAELYADLDTEEDVTIYTDQHTRSMEIKLGVPVSMNRVDCNNDPGASCSRGLHIKSKRYGLNLGSEVLICLVNPYNIVAVPTYDNTKFRCCEYLPIAKAEMVNGELVEWEDGTYDLDYPNYTRNELDKLFQNNSLEELKEMGIISQDACFEEISKLLSRRVIDKRNE